MPSVLPPDATLIEVGPRDGFQMETRLIPPGFDFESLPGLSNEARQKLSEIRPRTLGQASRIAGVSPSDMATLFVALEKGLARV